MIIRDLPYFALVSHQEEIIGGKKNNYNNKAAATSLAFAEGTDTIAIAGTSVYLKRGVSKANSIAVSKAM
jgi:hypothetical protein